LQGGGYLPNFCTFAPAGRRFCRAYHIRPRKGVFLFGPKSVRVQTLIALV
jgi:hypothetical protein